jgi:hypothetical protein
MYDFQPHPLSLTAEIQKAGIDPIASVVPETKVKDRQLERPSQAQITQKSNLPCVFTSTQAVVIGYPDCQRAASPILWPVWSSQFSFEKTDRHQEFPGGRIEYSGRPAAVNRAGKDFLPPIPES